MSTSFSVIADRESEYAMRKESVNQASKRGWRTGAGRMAFVAFFILGGGVAGHAQDAENARKLTLKEAVTLAVTNSRDLALARMQYGLVQRQAGVARSPFRPNFYAGTGAAYTNGFPLLEGGERRRSST